MGSSNSMLRKEGGWFKLELREGSVIKSVPRHVFHFIRYANRLA